jgi:hypothetical protein
MTTSTTIHHRSDLADVRLGRAGMTLLEVLVALGILVAGLASVAALMPAAGARLADATAIDRAGTLAANAHADLRNRGLLTASLFPANRVITASTSHICVIGDAFPDTPFLSGTSFISGTFSKYAIPGTLPTFTMTLQDDLQLSGTTLLTNTTSVSYAATVLPTATGTLSAGSPVRVGVVVFKRPNVEWMPLILPRLGTGIYRVSVTGSSTVTPQDESARKRFLPACSWVFATSTTAPAQSRWLQVGSSWTVSGTPCVSFSDTESSVLSSETITVQAFTNVLRVDERPAILK